MALYAMNRFPGDGSTTSYEFNFVGKYIARNHVRVYQENDTTKERTYIQLTDGNFLNDTTLAGLPATPVGSTLVICRDTPKAPLVDFVNGSRFTEHNLDLVARQGLFVAVESLADGGNGGGGGYSIPLPMPEANKLLGWNGTGTELMNYAQPSGGVSGPAPDLSAYVTKAQLASIAGASMVGILDGPTPSTVSAVIDSLRANIEANRIIATDAAAFNSLLASSSLSANHFYVLTDTAQVRFATGPSANFLVGGGGGGGGGATGFDKTKIVVMGDSMAAVQAGLSDAWPERWATLLRNCGVPVDLVNIAIGGYTFNKANTLTSGYSGETMVQRAIALAPDIVVVCLGANDAILNVESRTLAQTQADANSCLSALRAGLPSATIIVCNEYMYDADGFPSPATTLKNKGVFPYIMARPASGLLGGCWGAEVLDNDVGSATRTAFSNWANLMGTVNDHGAVNGTMQLNAWKAFRLGLGGLDGVHLTSVGNQFLAAYALRASRYLPALMARWPKLNLDTFDTWADPDAIFAGVLTRSGENWNINADTYPSDFVSKHGQIQSYRPETWWAPSGAVVNISSLSHPANRTFPTYWSVTNARPRSVCQVSVDGGAWGGAATTDAYGDAQFMANGAALAVGTHTLRYKVGNEVFGPFTQVTTATSETLEDTSVVPSIQLRRGSDWTPTAGAFTAVPYDVTIHNRGGGSYASGTYTVPKSGSYFVSHIVGTLAPASGGLIIAAVFVNGASAVEGGPQTNTDPYTSRYAGSTAAGVVYLNAGDVVTWTVYTSPTASVVGPGARNRSCTASLCYLGA